jgi:hypothetical protein
MLRIPNIGCILGQVNMQARFQLPTKLTGFAHRIVGNGKGGVEAYHTSNEQAVIFRDEAATLGKPPLRFVSTAVTLARAIAKDGPNSQLLTDIGQDVERAFNEVGRFVVIY